MKREVFIVFVTLVMIASFLLAACAPLAPAPAPLPTNSESDSSVAELEAKIRQLEAENQRLRTENEELKSDLAKLSNWLQDIHNLVTSSSYSNTLNKLNEIQNDTSDLVTWIGGLPSLPPLPLGLTISEIDDAINKARDLRRLLELLPPPLPFAPREWRDLDDMKKEFIEMTKWMENLQDLPRFLASTQSLEDLRSRIEGYIDNVDSTSFDARLLLEEVRDAGSR